MTKFELFILIVKNIIVSISSMLLKFVMTLPIATICTGVAILIINKLEKKGIKLEKKRSRYVVIFVSYLVIMLQMAIFFREIGSFSEIDLIPFNTPGGIPHIILYSIANAFVFLPVGILPPMIWKKMNDLKKILLAGFLGSLFIEICQLVLQCGVCQTEDLIMNTVGAGVGYWIYKKVIDKNTD